MKVIDFYRNSCKEKKFYSSLQKNTKKLVIAEAIIELCKNLKEKKEEEKKANKKTENNDESEPQLNWSTRNKQNNLRNNTSPMELYPTEQLLIQQVSQQDFDRNNS